MEARLIDALERGTSDLLTAPAPIDAVITHAAQAARRRRMAGAAVTGVLATALLVLIFARPFESGSGDSTSQVASDPTATSSAAPRTDDLPAPPDELIQAATDSGQPGYIYRRDLWTPECDTPKSCTEMMQKLKDAGVLLDNGEVRVPVYARDGATIIGYFTSGRVTLGDNQPAGK